MSEWLTTGQLIEKLNIGEEAVCGLGCMHLKKNENGEIVHLDHPQGTAMLNKGILTAKWRILPKYVTFEEAMTALRSGKTVVYKGDDGDSWNHKMAPNEFETYAIGETEFKQTGLRHMLDGKWEIIE